MAHKSEIILDKYSIFSRKKTIKYTYDLDEKNLIQSDAIDSESKPSGWVVDMEHVLDGPKEIIFFSKDDEKYIAIGKDLYKKSDEYNVVHKKGIFLSTMTIKRNENDPSILHEMKYITPWWRLFFDDGQFPERLFPIEYFLLLHGWIKSGKMFKV